MPRYAEPFDRTHGEYHSVPPAFHFFNVETRLAYVRLLQMLPKQSSCIVTGAKASFRVFILPSSRCAARETTNTGLLQPRRSNWGG